MILRKFLFLKDLEPRDSYKKKFYNNDGEYSPFGYLTYINIFPGLR